MIHIRPATTADVARITEIYNDAILHTSATFDLEIKTVEDRMKWFLNRTSLHPVLVAVSENKVVGYCSLGRWSERCGYDGTAEVGIYIDAAYRGKGIGTQMLEILTAEAEKLGLHSLISRITQGNLSSIHIHEKFGFEHVGLIKEAGKKFDKYHDVHMMQKMFPGNP